MVYFSWMLPPPACPLAPRLTQVSIALLPPRISPQPTRASMAFQLRSHSALQTQIPCSPTITLRSANWVGPMRARLIGVYPFSTDARFLSPSNKPALRADQGPFGRTEP